MSRKSFLTSAIVAGAALTSCMATAPAALADTPETTTSDSVEAQGDWGVNKDGWDVSITNNTGETLKYSPLESFGVKTAPPTLIENGGAASVKGKSLFYAEPVHLFITFSASDPAVNRFVEVKKSGIRCGTHENRGLINDIRVGDRCEVVQGDLSKALEIRFTA